MFDGGGHYGAQLIAAPRSIVRDDANAWRWVATHLIPEVEAKARMQDQIRTAARQWQDQSRPDGLLPSSPPTTRPAATRLPSSMFRIW